MTFRIAIVQPISHRPGEDERNVADAVSAIEHAAHEGADFVCFPETYPGPWRMPATFDPIGAMAEAAATHGVHVVFGTIEPIDRKAELVDAERLAASGLRVLAVAMRRLPSLPGDLEEAESGQTFLGLVGLLDPPRAEARGAVALCQSAGIHVVMITGDHPATARAIAERVGIAVAGDAIVTGAELASMSAEELEARVRDIRVYARVAAEDKIRIVTSDVGGDRHPGVRHSSARELGPSAARLRRH